MSTLKIAPKIKLNFSYKNNYEEKNCILYQYLKSLKCVAYIYDIQKLTVFKTPDSQRSSH